MLVKCKCIEIMWQDGLPNLYVNSQFPDYIVTNYTTKERALEILDEIQKLLMPHLEELSAKIQLKANNSEMPKNSNVMAIMQSSGDCQIQEFSNVVYEMPLE